jgi:tetratricopeptide (TPR) repeat protein
VSTQNALAQRLANAGLLYYYAYDSGDSVDAFTAAAAQDPNLAMAFWGEALAYGPDLNTPMSEQRFALGKAAAEKAVALERNAGLPERKFIDAMALRYQGTWADWKDNDRAYRSAMSVLASDPPSESTTVATLLTAEAALESGGLTWIGTSPATPEARRALELVNRVLSSDPGNLMANHLCLHVYDLSEDRTPARACAQHLDAATLPPQGEHLAHMPAHYWIESGNYAAALASSERAYQLFTRLQGVPGRNPEHDRYLAHDAYVGYSAAMMLGDYAVAKTWSSRMNAAYETSYDGLTALRFGRYADAFALARGPTPNDLAVRGLAALQLGNLADAGDIGDRLRKLTTYGDLVQIFYASLAQSQGHPDDARRWIDRAVVTQRDNYAAETIPLLPALEVQGQLAMQRGDFAGALASYRSALDAYPNDPRALDGLAAAQKAGDAKP